MQNVFKKLSEIQPFPLNFCIHHFPNEPIGTAGGKEALPAPIQPLIRRCCNRRYETDVIFMYFLFIFFFDTYFLFYFLFILREDGCKNPINETL
jgi:hypothetical protein